MPLMSLIVSGYFVCHVKYRHETGSYTTARKQTCTILTRKVGDVWIAGVSDRAALSAGLVDQKPRSSTARIQRKLEIVHIPRGKIQRRVQA